MKDSHYYCIIMAGGLGSRIWPLSREERPKQFLKFAYSGMSFLKMAWRRAQDVIPEDNIYVVSLERYRDTVVKELPTLPDRNILLEPVNRNTASCIAYATYCILKRDPQAVVLVLPADQVIDDSDAFRSTVLRGLDYAATHDELVTLGIIPTRPDTNFGYIQTVGPTMDGRPVRVKTFTEKPEKEMAQVFVDSGEFLWNAGIFIWKASVIAKELQLHAPEVAAQWKDWEKYISTPLEREYLEEIYPGMPRISIDYAVMEQSERVIAIPAFFDWTDLGSWESIYEYFHGADDDANTVRTAGKLVTSETSGSVILSKGKGRLVAVKGLKDYLVVDIDDVLLICPREDKEFKDFLSELSLPEYEEYK
ncbi:MAG: mannose-1-phosphate guanylyltransferase [Bacteroidales bacterium]|nr:mannose-1-phosphate guanylyltransferase [Bacteroidales bacterium]